MLHDLYPRADLQAAAVTMRLVTVLAELTVLAAVTAPLWGRRRPREVAHAEIDTIGSRAGFPGDSGEG
jgi:hypothetical protein